MSKKQKLPRRLIIYTDEDGSLSIWGSTSKVQVAFADIKEPLGIIPEVTIREIREITYPDEEREWIDALFARCQEPPSLG